MTLSADEKYQQLCQHVRTTNLLTTVDSLLGWDERTQLPPAAGSYRAEQTHLAGLIHDRHDNAGKKGGLGTPAGSERRSQPI